MVPKGHNQLHQALPAMIVKSIVRIPSEINGIQFVKEIRGSIVRLMSGSSLKKRS
jgi:hypothetical protein